MNAAKRFEIFRRLHEDNPEPKTELAYSTPFELLVAVTLSAQATDVSVNKATAKLFPVANTPEAIYALGVEGLSEYIKTIGLYNSKAKNVIEACRILIEKHGSQVPDNREDLEALPVSAARPPTWCSIPRFANWPWPWTRIFFASATAPASHRVRTWSRWRRSCSSSCPRIICSTPITG